MKTSLLVIFLSVLAVSACDKGPTEPRTDKQKLSYALGHQVGKSIKRDGLEVDAKALTQAIEDVLADTSPRMSPEEMQAAIVAFRKKSIEERRATAAKTKKAGEEFLAANKAKEGVIVLPSGLQYKVIKKGSGKKPKASETVVANYRGTLINGTEFDSSYSRGKPETFPVNGVIKGWQEVLPLMREGAKWRIFVPTELAYGSRGAGDAIGPNETLVFDIELVKVKVK